MYRILDAMQKLIDEGDLAKVIKVKPEIAKRLFPFIMKVFSLEKLNDIYEKGNKNSPLEFTVSVLDGLGIKFEIPQNEIERLPKEGPFITVSNHPYGGIEGLLLISLLGKKFPNFKLLTNFLLERVIPLKSYFLSVNPFDDNKQLASSLSGIKQALEHLKNKGVLSLFPAGEVSSFQTNSRKIVDREWQKGALKLIYKANVPVVPIYFKGSNSRFFNLLGLIHPRLRTAKLPSEIFNKKQQKITIRIGKPILPNEINGFEDANQMGRFLRAKTYALGSALEVSTIFNLSLKRFEFLRLQNKMKPIADPISNDLIQQEIKSLSKERMLLAQGDYEVYLAYSTEIPNALKEIGRLRELTFRKIDEGTGNRIDLDEYDLYYHQLILWNRQKQRIVGGYRIGKGNDIIGKYGKKGFYLHSLFKLKNSFTSYLAQSIELGRSYIIEEEQKKPMPLFLLWKGILFFVLNNPEYCYLIGPVSISNHYSKLSKALIIEFIRQNYFDEYLASFIKARHPFKTKLSNDEKEVLLSKSKKDIKLFDRFIEEIEPSHYTLPVLLKKYIKQKAKIIGFNVDPKFKNALDGLIFLEIQKIPSKTIENLKNRN